LVVVQPKQLVDGISYPPGNQALPLLAQEDFPVSGIGQESRLNENGGEFVNSGLIFPIFTDTSHPKL
jgi:hypothetical protein